MKELLSIEWMKLKHYRAFKVFGILYLLGTISMLFIMYVIFQHTPETRMLAYINNPFAFPSLWNTAGWLNSWLLFFPGWLIINHCVNEFNFKTHRQNVIDGWSRQQFISAKLLLVLAFAIVITIITIISTIIMSALLHTPFSFSGIESMGYVFVQSVVYLLFALMLAILLRKSGLAAGIFFLYGLIFEFMLSKLINITFHMSPAGYFLPLQVSDELTPIPFLSNMIKDVPPVFALLLGCAAYCAVYVATAFRKFRNDDL